MRFSLTHSSPSCTCHFQRGSSVLWLSSSSSLMQSWTLKTVCVCVCVCLRFQYTKGLWCISSHVYLNEDQALEYRRSLKAHGDCCTGFLLLAVIHPLHHPEEFNSKRFCSFSSFLTIFPFFAVARRCNHVLQKQFCESNAGKCCHHEGSMKGLCGS